RDTESVRRMWQTHLADIELTDTRWLEKYDCSLLERALQITAENRRNGRRFETLDEKNVGKYVMGVIRKLKKGPTVKKTGAELLVKAEVWFEADYKITEADKDRFQSYLKPSNDCLLFDGASTTGRYGKFWINRRS